MLVEGVKDIGHCMGPMLCISHCKIKKNHIIDSNCEAEKVELSIWYTEVIVQFAVGQVDCKVIWVCGDPPEEEPTLSRTRLFWICCTNYFFSDNSLATRPQLNKKVKPIYWLLSNLFARMQIPLTFQFTQKFLKRISLERFHYKDNNGACFASISPFYTMLAKI